MLRVRIRCEVFAGRRASVRQRQTYRIQPIMMFLFLLLPILIFAETARPQNSGTIIGRVVEHETNVPIPGAAIRLEGRTLGAVANDQGAFVVEKVPSGTHVVVVSAIGFAKERRQVVVHGGDTTLLEIVLSPDVLAFEEVTATGERVFSAASSEFMRALDFELRPKHSAQDMLRMVPGLVIAQHAGGGKAEQLFLRGFDADHGTDVNLSVDGVPVNMVSHGHGQGYADLHFVIPEVVEGMEVFKGPYFAAFGDLATAGSVRLTTREALERNMVSVEGGMFGTYRALGMVRLPMESQTTNAYLAGELYHTDGYFDTRIDLNRYNLFGKLVSPLDEKNRLTVWASAFSSTWDATGQIPARAVARGTIGRFGSIDPSEGGKTERFNVNVHHHITLNGTATLRAQAYASRYQFRLFSNFSFFAIDSVNGDGIEQNDDRFLYGGLAEFTSQHSIGTLPAITLLGVSYRTDAIDLQLHHQRQRERLGVIADAMVHQSNLALYAQEEVRLTKSVKAQLGVRTDLFFFDVKDRVTNPAHEPVSGFVRKALVTPKLNVVVSPGTATDLFFNVGGGFHSNDARAVVSGKAERTLPRAWGAELGIRANPMHLLNIAAAVWGLDLQNELVYVGDEGTTEINGPTRRIGIDMEVRAQLADWLFADADMTLARGRFKQAPKGEDFIPLAPTLTLNAGLTVRHPSGAEAMLRVRHVSERPANADNSVTALGYSIFDASMAYRFGAYRVQVTAENLFDTPWNEAQFDTRSRLRGESAPVSELHFTPGTPFHLKAKAEFHF